MNKQLLAWAWLPVMMLLMAVMVVVALSVHEPSDSVPMAPGPIGETLSPSPLA